MSDWESELSEEDRAQWEAFVQHHRENTVREMAESSLVISLFPSNEKADVKYAVELGFSIMLDKPIMLVVMPGCEIPPKLVQVADLIVETDIDTEKGKEVLQQALHEMYRRFNLKKKRKKKGK